MIVANAIVMVRSAWLFAAIIGPLAFSLGCEANVDIASGGTGGNATTGGQGTGGATSGNPCFPDSCSGPSSTSGAGGAFGTPCGVKGGLECPAGSYCDFAHDSCGKPPEDTTPSCKSATMACGQIDDSPACGCDNQTYASRCEAHAAGFDIGGVCPTAPPGMFQCRGRFCEIATEYCDIEDYYGSGSAACLPYPAECNGAAICDCISKACTQAHSCTASPSGGLTWYCYND